MLWCRATKVSQQALCERFLVFLAELFERVFKDLLPQLQVRWLQRQQRPLPDSVNFALKHFERIWVADGESSAYGRFPAVGTGEPEGLYFGSLVPQAQKFERAS